MIDTRWSNSRDIRLHPVISYHSYGFNAYINDGPAKGTYLGWHQHMVGQEPRFILWVQEMEKEYSRTKPVKEDKDGIRN